MFDEIEADVRAALPAESWSTSRVVACTMLAVRNICHMLRRDFAHEHMILEDVMPQMGASPRHVRAVLDELVRRHALVRRYTVTVGLRPPIHMFALADHPANDAVTT